MLLTAMLMCACQMLKTSPTILTIGLAEEPRTVNIWLAGDSNSAKILSQIYDPLYIMEPGSLDYVPWLASALPVFDSSKLT